MGNEYEGEIRYLQGYMVGQSEMLAALPHNDADVAGVCIRVHSAVRMAHPDAEKIAGAVCLEIIYRFIFCTRTNTDGDPMREIGDTVLRVIHPDFSDQIKKRLADEQSDIDALDKQATKMIDDFHLRRNTAPDGQNRVFGNN